MRSGQTAAEFRRVFAPAKAAQFWRSSSDGAPCVVKNGNSRAKLPLARRKSTKSRASKPKETEIMPAAVDRMVKDAKAAAEKIGSEPANGDQTSLSSMRNLARLVASTGNFLTVMWVWSLIRISGLKAMMNMILMRRSSPERIYWKLQNPWRRQNN